jgi:hypothetical protein
MLPPDPPICGILASLLRILEDAMSVRTLDLLARRALVYLVLAR